MRKLLSWPFSLLIFSILIFILLEIKSLRAESLTWDEVGHYNEGLVALTKNHFTTSPNSPTFIPQLAALPSVFGLDKIVENSPYPSERLIFSRLVIVFFTILLSINIFFFSSFLFDQATALLSTMFFLFEPTIFAHAHYITLDMGFTLLFFIAYWFLFLLIKKPNRLLAIFSGFSLGLVFASKVTAVGFFALIIFLLALNKRKEIKRTPKVYLMLFSIFILIGIWFTYRFSFGNLGGFTEGGNRLSNKIHNQLLNKNAFIAEVFKKSLSLPLPLGDFPRILKNAYVFNLGEKTAFFMGEMRKSSGILMLTLFILKTPITILILFILGLISIPKKENFWIVFIPIFSIFSFTFISNIDLRIRYLMPLYPFFFIIAARSFILLFKKFKELRVSLLLLLVWFFISLRLSFPHPISYANEATSFFDKPYLIFSDSNIDWGQGLAALNKYAKTRDIGKINLSYYGVDDPNQYGFFGFAKENICKASCTLESTYFNFQKRDREVTAISITNWQECGWYKTERYSPEKVKDVVGGSILIFE